MTETERWTRELAELRGLLAQAAGLRFLEAEGSAHYRDVTDETIARYRQRIEYAGRRLLTAIREEETTCKSSTC